MGSALEVEVKVKVLEVKVEFEVDDEDDRRLCRHQEIEMKEKKMIKRGPREVLARGQVQGRGSFSKWWKRRRR